MTKSRRIRPTFSASFDREKDWKRCCSAAMGFEWVDHFDDASEYYHQQEQESREANSDFRPIQQLINLVDTSVKITDEDVNPREYTRSGEVADHWVENACRIQMDLSRMATWIRSKQQDYVSLDMDDDEASLIQSTVTSFAATTASELETLRKIIPDSSSDVASHRNGIVQILLSQLQEQITKPFGSLQKQRTRIAVQLWQNPFQCKLYQPKSRTAGNNDSMMLLFDDEEPTQREQRFLPRHNTPPEDYDFLSNYADTIHDALLEAPKRPNFLTTVAHRSTLLTRDETSLEGYENQSDDSTVETDNLAPKLHETPPPIPQEATILPYQQPTSEESRRQALEEELQQEVEQLTVAVHSDLDSVQKMEERMVEITTLISQFSNLVSEQQEDILMIHESAEKSKENMDKGQENLVDATERTKRSRHFIAWTVFAMSMTLLFFHTMRN